MHPVKTPQKHWGEELTLGAETMALARGAAAGRQVGWLV